MSDNKIKWSHADLQAAARRLADKISKIYEPDIDQALRVYAIPRGGIPAALAVGQVIPLILVDKPGNADLFIDDIIDSGATRDRYKKLYPDKEMYALVNKTEKPSDGWIVFPWEGDAEGSFEDNVVRLLQFVGEDPERGGLKETPARVAKAWQQWCRGYGQDPKDVLKVFEDGAEKHDQMITVQNIPFYTHCEHHLAPFFGTATVAYVPNGKIVGLSKLSRVVDIFARRLQVQERLTDQIADALFEHLQPLGVGVSIKARHLCMESRGVCQQGHQTITTALRGVMREEPAARAEFMRQV